MFESTPPRQIRAFFTQKRIRVYQAYSGRIAAPAVQNNSFDVPGFKIGRMTWIKPSFLWMMYRAGWGLKEAEQERILAIDIPYDCFAWALMHSSLSTYHPEVHGSREAWQLEKAERPVRIQWDPERDIELNKLPYRSIQIGLSGEAARRYACEWQLQISDITPKAQEIHAKVRSGDLVTARRLLPEETPYPLTAEIAAQIGADQ